MSAIQVEQLLAGLIDSSGEPLAGGKVYTYEAGTTTPKTTWQDLAKTTPHTNPIILDSIGQKLVFADGAYKFDIDDANDVDIATWDDLVFEQEGDNLVWAGNTTGSSNAYVLTPSTPLTAYAAGQTIRAVSNFANTGACTINVSSLGAVNIKLVSGRDPVAGQIQNSMLMNLFYDGTNAILLNPFTGIISHTSTPGAQSGTWAPTVTYNYAIDPSGEHYTAYVSTTSTAPSGTPNYLTLTAPIAAVALQFSTGYVNDGGDVTGTITIQGSSTTHRIYTDDQAALSGGAVDVYFDMNIRIANA